MTLFILTCITCFAVGLFIGQILKIQSVLADNFFPYADKRLRELRDADAEIEFRRRELSRASLQLDSIYLDRDYAIKERDELQAKLDSLQGEEARRMLRYHAEQLAAWLETDDVAKLISRDREVIPKDAN